MAPNENEGPKVTALVISQKVIHILRFVGTQEKSGKPAEFLCKLLLVSHLVGPGSLSVTSVTHISFHIEMHLYEKLKKQYKYFE